MTDGRPIYQQVRDHVVSMIIDGVLDRGDPIPSVRQMAVEGREILQLKEYLLYTGQRKGTILYGKRPILWSHISNCCSIC